MYFKKKLLSTLVLALPAVHAFADVGQQGTAQGGVPSLRQLRQQCERLSQNTQIKKFEIKVECSGSYELIHQTPSSVVLPRSEVMHTQTSTKCGRFETQESMYSLEPEGQTVQCTQYVKERVSAPEGMGLPITITNCSELNPENMRNLCQAKVRDYCEGNLASSGDAAQGKAEGMCVSSQVEVVDACTLYNQQQTQSQSQTQTDSKS